MTITATDNANLEPITYYTQCPHHHETKDTILCRDPWAPRNCAHPGLCCWECDCLPDCPQACLDAADSAARDMAESVAYEMVKDLWRTK